MDIVQQKMLYNNVIYKPLFSLLTVIKWLKSKKIKPINKIEAIVIKYDLNNLIFSIVIDPIFCNSIALSFLAETDEISWIY